MIIGKEEKEAGRKTKEVNRLRFQMGALRGPLFRKSMGKALESEGVGCGAL